MFSFFCLNTVCPCLKMMWNQFIKWIMFPLLRLQLERQCQGQAFSPLNQDLEQQKKAPIIIFFKEPHKSQKGMHSPRPLGCVEEEKDHLLNSSTRVHTLTHKHNTLLNPRSPCTNPDGPLKDGSHQARSLSQWTCGCRPGWVALVVEGGTCVFGICSFMFCEQTDLVFVCLCADLELGWNSRHCCFWTTLKTSVCVRVSACVYVRKKERERESAKRNIRAAFMLLVFRETFSVSQGCGKLPTIRQRLNCFTSLSHCNIYNTTLYSGSGS